MTSKNINDVSSSSSLSESFGVLAKMKRDTNQLSDNNNNNSTTVTLVKRSRSEPSIKFNKISSSSNDDSIVAQPLIKEEPNQTLDKPKAPPKKKKLSLDSSISSVKSLSSSNNSTVINNNTTSDKPSFKSINLQLSDDIKQQLEQFEKKQKDNDKKIKSNIKNNINHSTTNTNNNNNNQTSKTTTIRRSKESLFDFNDVINDKNIHKDDHPSIAIDDIVNKKKIKSRLSSDDHLDNNNNNRKKKVAKKDINTLSLPTTTTSKLMDNQKMLDNARRIIKSLQSFLSSSSSSPSMVCEALIELSTIICNDKSQISLILRSHNLFSTLNHCLLKLYNNNNNPNNPTPLSSPSNSTSSVGASSSSSNISSSSSTSSLVAYKKSTSSLQGDDLLKQFLSTTSSSSLLSSSSNNNSGIDDSFLNDSVVGELDSNSHIITDSMDSSSCSNSNNNNPSPSTRRSINKSNDEKNTSVSVFSQQESKGIVLSICFIYYQLSSLKSNIDQFSRDVIDMILDQATTIPDNYQSQYFSSPSKLPKSPKQQQTRKIPLITESISSLFHQYIADAGRISPSPSSLSLNVLCNLITQQQQPIQQIIPDNQQQQQPNSNPDQQPPPQEQQESIIDQTIGIKSKFREYKVIDKLIILLSKYTLYINPLIDSSTVSPKLIGNIEKVTKILDECVVHHKSNIDSMVNTNTISILITLLFYIQNIILGTKEKLSGIDIKLGGSESVISILNILLNITHSNRKASSIIGSIKSPYQYHNNNNINNNGYLDPTDQLEKHLTQVKMTPRKAKYIATIQECNHFGIVSIMNLLHMEVPDKYDVAQLSVTLLVNLMEGDPENRVRFRSTSGAIESILKQYIRRTSERVLTRFTSQTQEKVASSYLVILIGFLVKDNQENRNIVANRLLNPDHNHNNNNLSNNNNNSNDASRQMMLPFIEMVKLLKDFIQFQGSKGILSKDIYRICHKLILFVFLQNDDINHNDDNDKDTLFVKQEIEKYNKFKFEFEFQYHYTSNDDSDDEDDQFH